MSRPRILRDPTDEEWGAHLEEIASGDVRVVVSGTPEAIALDEETAKARTAAAARKRDAKMNAIAGELESLIRSRRRR